MHTLLFFRRIQRPITTLCQRGLVRMADPPPSKRQRLDTTPAEQVRAQRSAFLSSLSRGVSPPQNGSISERNTGALASPEAVQAAGLRPLSSKRSKRSACGITSADGQISPEKALPSRKMLPSPFKLTRVTGLPAEDNVDTISLHDILGDPLIREAWIFNYCFDVTWMMQHFDEDVRQMVNVKIVHGSWKKEDGNRIGIEHDLRTWKNVQAIQAYLPDQFGTHHSKMIILFKHDDTAQVVIHTANMLEKDWEHMTQAVWQSPVLPMLAEPSGQNAKSPAFGSGSRFKYDLVSYIRAYGSRLKALSEQLSHYDFSSIRAALIASVPSNVKASDPPETKWGHLALRQALHKVAETTSTKSEADKQHLVCQVSSIATLPAAWLSEAIVKAATTGLKPPTISIIYPTPSDLRNALTGYATGGSIHTKIASAAQQRQVANLRPHLHRWGAKSLDGSAQAGRHLVPPHIKTYICFNSPPTSANPVPDIEWALVTSANLSQQAWGTAGTGKKGGKDPGQGASHISSFEIGVLVWPELFLDGSEDNLPRSIVRIAPLFGKNEPEVVNTPARDTNEVVVGFRMPYDLPLTPYETDEMPWSPSATYTQRDRLGQTWT